MTLREEFENTMKNEKGGVSLLFEVRNSQYIEWLEKELSKLRQGAVMPCFSLVWNETAKSLPKVNESCLAIRRKTNLCNLYYDGSNWMDDGYDSKSESIFVDVTHWILLSDIPLAK